MGASEWLTELIDEIEGIRGSVMTLIFCFFPDTKDRLYTSVRYISQFSRLCACKQKSITDNIPALYTYNLTNPHTSQNITLGQHIQQNAACPKYHVLVFSGMVFTLHVYSVYFFLIHNYQLSNIIIHVLLILSFLVSPSL